MIRRRLNRREALGLGAAAVAAGALRPRSALAAGTSLFELALPSEGAHAAGGWRVTPVLHAPRRFDLMGLRWKRGGRLEAQVRARRRGGSWSPWLPLHTAGDHAPDGADAPAGTARHLTGRLRRKRPVRARESQSSQPAIISRSEWGGDSVPPRAAPEYGEVQAAFVHHTVSTNDYRREDSAGIVLGCAGYH